MKRHRRLWEQIITFENPAGAARDALRGKRGRVVGAAFFGQWETEVVRLERELRERTYRPGRYRCFRILHPKERVVAAAPFRDRVVHHALVRVLEPIFEKRFIEDSFACRRGMGTHAAMRDYLAGLRLEIHSDKYRLVRTAVGLDFCGFVVRADGRIRVRGRSVRRFLRRYRRQRWELKQGRLAAAALTQSVRAWIAHVSHGQSVGLRRAVLSR